MIKNFGEYPTINGFNKYESDILGMNGITNDNIAQLLPDLNNDYDIDDYLNLMTKIDNGQAFVDFIKANKEKKYCVVGDYDVDGIMATSIMAYGLMLYGCDVTYTIPNRFSDGYGMHDKQIDIAKENNADIIITVDNGIVANGPIDYAHKCGIKVVVTDHHTPQGICNGDLVFDPLYNNDEYKTISGATVAMKLIYELYRDMYPIGPVNEYMKNFVCMAFFTVYSDVMPMIGENRYLTVACTKYANENISVPNSFINRLAKLVEFYVPGAESDACLNLADTFRDFNKDNIDFYFVPILNACNRVLGYVDDLVYDIMSLFVNDYQGDAHMYSDINKKRKFMRSELLSKHKANDETSAVVEALTPEIWDENYAGIVGLVASDVVEDEHKPALIGIDVRNDTDIVRFSGRSVSGFNLYEALSQIKNEHPELSLNFGGHAEALGASCIKSDIPALQNYLSEKFSNATIENVEMAEPIYYKIDKFSATKLKEAFYKLAPFGNKFSLPKFYVEDQVAFLDKGIRSFTLKNLGKEHRIVYFDKATQNKLSDYAFTNRTWTFRGVVEFMENEHGVLVFKLVKIL